MEPVRYAFGVIRACFLPEPSSWWTRIGRDHGMRKQRAEAARPRDPAIGNLIRRQTGAPAQSIS